jgi:hypothetical protein
VVEFALQVDAVDGSFMAREWHGPNLAGCAHYAQAHQVANMGHTRAQTAIPS